MSTNAIGVIAFIFGLIVMIVFHEFGHFWTARRFGIKVEEFFLGFGPKLFSRRMGETEVGVKAILLGGYVRIAGMNPFQKIPDDEYSRTFPAKPAWQRSIVLVAGSATHMILATLMFSSVYMIFGSPNPEKPQIDSVDITVNGADGPAKTAGLREGDRVLKINATALRSWEKGIVLIRASAGRELKFTIEREGRSLVIPVTPIETDAEDLRDPKKTVRAGQIGIQPGEVMERKAPHVALARGLGDTGASLKVSVVGIKQIFSPRGLGGVFAALRSRGDRVIGDEQPIGLVGGGRLAGQAVAAFGIGGLIGFLALFVVFVGVANLLPLPPLDGGHLAVLAIEKVTRRKVDMRKVVPVATAVLGFLIVLNLAILYLDIFRPLANPFQ